MPPVIPADVGREFIGEKAPKKRTHRGRKPSAKPGASHLSALQKAHGEGDHASAKRHALNYANEVHKHLKGSAVEMDPDADDVGEMEAPAPKPQLVAGDRRAQLAKIAMSRKKSAISS